MFHMELDRGARYPWPRSYADRQPSSATKKERLERELPSWVHQRLKEECIQAPQPSESAARTRLKAGEKV